MARTKQTKQSKMETKMAKKMVTLKKKAAKMTKSWLKANISARVTAIGELSNNKYAAEENADEIVAVGNEIEVLEEALRAKSTSLVDGDYHESAFYSTPTSFSFRDCPSPTASQERGPTFSFTSTRL